MPEAVWGGGKQLRVDLFGSGRVGRGLTFASVATDTLALPPLACGTHASGAPNLRPEGPFHHSVRSAGDAAVLVDNLTG
ncbi:MAG: hypothetical protein ACRDRO_17645, partial [Pseudonocardiaceae bacterium]